MMNRLIHIVVLFYLMLTYIDAAAQEGEVQLRFSATEVSGKVFLEWTMDLGQTCNGIDITRSTDGVNFQLIGDIAGVCGSPFDTVSYSFIDETPVPNQINYYRLTLGNLGPSQTLSIEIIDLKGSGYQVRPNPISAEGFVYFSNDRGETYRLTLISMNGAAQRSYTTRDEFFRLDVSGLEAGLYVFRIDAERGEPRAIGKILVAR